jgi:hypothetical protein
MVSRPSVLPARVFDVMILRTPTCTGRGTTTGPSRGARSRAAGSPPVPT